MIAGTAFLLWKEINFAIHIIKRKITAVDSYVFGHSERFWFRIRPKSRDSGICV